MLPVCHLPGMAHPATPHAMPPFPWCVTTAELDAAELREEFAKRLGEQQRTIDTLKVMPAGGGRAGKANLLNSPHSSKR